MDSLRDFLETNLASNVFKCNDTIIVKTQSDDIISISEVGELLDSESDCLDMTQVADDRDDDDAIVVVVE